MRSLTANSSGATGVHLSQRLQSHGRLVHLWGQMSRCFNLTVRLPSGIHLYSRSPRKNESWTVQHPTGIIIHAAAVGDFEVRDTHQGKISSGSTLTLEFQPTPKIVDLIKGWSSDSMLVSFKAAAPNTH